MDTVQESPPSRSPDLPIPKPTHDEAELVSAIHARDRKATALFVAKYADGLFAYLRRRLEPRTDLAEDLLQEVFVTAFESIEKLQDPSALRAWLYGIARHKVEDHYRWVLRDAPADRKDQTPAVDADFERILDDERLEHRISWVMDGLDADYRAVLYWRYWEQRSCREMAVQLDRTEKAVERLLARARVQFKRRWNEAS